MLRDAASMCCAVLFGSAAIATTTETVTLEPEPAAVTSAFGFSAAIEFDTVIVGDPTADPDSGSAGGVWVFERNNGGFGAWGLTTRLSPAVALDRVEFGHRVRIDGDLAIVSDPGYVDPASLLATGGVFIFGRDVGGADAWGQIASIVPGDPVSGARFGHDIAIGNGIIAVGAPHALDGTGDPSGAAYLFCETAPGAWTQVEKISVDNHLGVERFGGGLDVEDPVLIVGAPGRVSGFGELDVGSYYVYDLTDFIARTGPTSLIEEAVSPERFEDDNFASAIRIDNGTMITGGVLTQVATFRSTVNLETWQRTGSLGSAIDKERGGVTLQGLDALVREATGVSHIRSTDSAFEVWTPIDLLSPSVGASASFGLAVDLDLFRAVIGDDATDSAYIFVVGNPSDLTRDGVVDGADLAALLSNWGGDSPAADLDKNGSVDGADLAALLAAWD